MPDRMLRTSILTSENFDNLSDAGESMFNRLLLNCDDFGRFEADHRVLLARCYPLKVGTMTLSDIAKRVGELVSAGIIRIYEVAGKPFGVFVKWAKHNRMRAKASKHPEPPEDDSACQHMLSDDSERAQRADIRGHSLSYPESESESEIPPTPLKGAKRVAIHLTEEQKQGFKREYPPRRGDQNWPQTWKRLEGALNAGAEWSEIVAGAARYASLMVSIGKSGSEFVKQATTWVNQKGWLDDVEAPSTNGAFKRNNPAKMPGYEGAH